MSQPPEPRPSDGMDGDDWEPPRNPSSALLGVALACLAGAVVVVALVYVAMGGLAGGPDGARSTAWGALSTTGPSVSSDTTDAPDGKADGSASPAEQIPGAARVGAGATRAPDPGRRGLAGAVTGGRQPTPEVQRTVAAALAPLAAVLTPQASTGTAGPAVPVVPGTPTPTGPATPVNPTPTTQPPTTQPPTTQPPSTSPPTTEPPSTSPPTTQPPST